MAAVGRTARPWTPDAVGAVVLATAIGWTVVSAGSAGGEPVPVVATLVACGLAVAAGRLAARVAPWAAAAAVVVAGGFLLARPGAFSSAPLQGPFGYANAAGSFFALAAVAALLLVATVPATWARGVGVAAFVAFAAVPLVRGALAPAALVVLVPLAFAAGRRPGGARSVVAAGAALFVVALLATVALGALDGGRGASGVSAAAESALSGRRVALWGDALSLMADHPVVGVGPGRFAEESDVARRDRDARWAHQEFLQQGAEQGMPGLALLVGLVLWGFWGLWVSPSAGATVALGAAALAVVAVHACVDYVFHFPAVPVAAAALVGAAQASAARVAGRSESDAAELVGA